MSLYEMFERLDEQLAQYSKTQKILLILFLFGGILFMSYYFFIDDELQTLESKKQEVATIQKKMKKYRSKIIERKIFKIKKELVALNSKIDTLTQNKYKLIKELNQKRVILFDKDSFARFLQDILADSKKRNLTLQKIDIHKTNKKLIGKIVQIRELVVEGYGDFLNVVHYLRDIESKKMLFKIANLAMTMQEEGLFFGFHLKLYGAQE